VFAAPHFAYGLAGGDRLASFARLADPRPDLAVGEGLFVRARGVAAVGPQLGRVDAGLRERIDQRQQVPLLVLVPGSDLDRERQPAAVDYEVETAAGRAPERARDLFAPFFASTSDASTITRDQSSRSASCSCSCSTATARWKAPRAAHSSIRRRHVSPLGNPNSR
jgi:hypothetical protein